MDTERKIVFLVDDSDSYLAKVGEVLDSNYEVVTFSSGKKMFSVLKSVAPHLILLDIEMPEMDGFQVLEQLKADEKYAHIPVIFLTGTHDPDIEARGIEFGAVDFIQKPFSALVLINRVKLHINVGQLVKEQTLRLKHAYEQLRSSYETMIYVLTEAVESRDLYTGGHLERSTRYVAVLIEEMLKRGMHTEELGKWDIKKVLVSALLHDVGKVCISDVILNKPGALTAEEFDEVKTHTVKGEEILDKIIKLTGDDELFYHAKMFVAYHHENWDGTGYPYGLKGEAIPLQGRIMAIVDTYDALTTQRPYKQAYSHEKAVEIIVESAEKRFDPKIVQVFLGAQDQFKALLHPV